MYYWLWIGLCLGAFFFLLVPLSGAFAVRKFWRVFRARALEAINTPIFNAQALFDKTWTGLLSGTLDGVDEESCIWVKTEGLSVRIPLVGASKWLLQENELDLESLRVPVQPSRLFVRDISGIPEGTGVLVLGVMQRQNGTICMRGSGRGALQILFYEGDFDSVLPRIIWSARQVNEFWNMLTPVSLIAGFVMLSIWSLLSLQASRNRLLSVLLATLAFIPFSVLLPPGLLGFIQYRNYWRTARILRALKELYQHKALFTQKIQTEIERMISLFDSKNLSISNDSSQSDTSKLLQIRRKLVHYESFALIIFVISVLINSFIIFWLLAQLMVQQL